MVEGVNFEGEDKSNQTIARLILYYDCAIVAFTCKLKNYVRYLRFNQLFQSKDVAKIQDVKNVS